MSKKPTSKSKSEPVKTSGPDLGQLERLFKLMTQHQVGEIEWETEKERMVVRSGNFAPHTSAYAGQMIAHAPSVSHSLAAPSAPAPSVPAAAPAVAAKASNIKEVLSPFVGTFYRSSAPGKDAYVREGTSVKRGDVLCIIEAMKLMNEIESEFQGKIKSILVENGQPVEFGEPLFTIEV